MLTGSYALPTEYLQSLYGLWWLAGATTHVQVPVGAVRATTGLLGALDGVAGSWGWVHTWNVVGITLNRGVA